MRDEPPDVHAVLVQRDAVGLLNDGEHLLDDARHAVGIGQVAGGEPGVDQMHGERDRLVGGQDAVQIPVELGDQPLGLRIFLRVQRLHLHLQRILDRRAVLQPAHGAGDVVGQRHDQRWLRFGLRLQPDAGHGIGHQTDDLGRNAGEQFRHMVGIAAIRGDEYAYDLRVIDLLAGPGLEAQPSTGDDHFARAVRGEHDVVVEYAKHFHDAPLPDLFRLSAGCRAPGRPRRHRRPSVG